MRVFVKVNLLSSLFLFSLRGLLMFICTVSCFLRMCLFVVQLCARVPLCCGFCVYAGVLEIDLNFVWVPAVLTIILTSVGFPGVKITFVKSIGRRVFLRYYNRLHSSPRVFLR